MKRVYVWEFPVRVAHWLYVLSIVTLSFTGFYIGTPFIYAASEESLVMATIRFIHFVAAYVFTVSMVVRVYWWFVGNKYAKWNQFLPLDGERWKNLVDTALFYAFLRKEIPHWPGHTGLAGLTYLAVFGLFALEIMTGFALYSQQQGGGAIWTLLGGWLLSIMSSGMVRFLHHITMWLIWIFVICHLYISWHNDRIERNALISSMFSGYKTMDEH